MARFVLAHDAFSGAWIWGPLIDHLNVAGHSVDAFDLPGLGDDEVRREQAKLEAQFISAGASSADPGEN